MKFELIVCQALALLADAAVVTSRSDKYVVHERRNAASLWKKLDRVPRDMLLPMRIGLKQSNLDKGHDVLMDLSRHDSPNFGNWYTAEQVTDLFAPSSESVNAVGAWLETSGITPDRYSQSTNRGWIQFDATSEEAEKLLLTEFFYFEHSEHGDRNIATDRYHVPQHIVQHIDYITPGVKLISNGNRKRNSAAANEKRQAAKKFFGPAIIKPLPPGIEPGTVKSFAAADPLAKCDQVMTPQCIQAMYGIPQGTKNITGNELGIYETGDQYSGSSLEIFFNDWYSIIPNKTRPIIKSVDGGVTDVSPSEAGPESCLDLELAYPIIWPQKAIVFQTDDAVYAQEFEKQGLFNNFLDAIDGSYCSFSYDGETGNDPTYDFSYPDPADGGYKGQLQCGVYTPPNVVSISYGVNEADYSVAYQQRQCQEFLKLGLQGVSVVLSSGDAGVGGRPGQNGHANGCLGTDGRIYNPGYPNTCPYMLTVGSTYLPAGHRVGVDPEIATESFSSGGGFSNVYPMPDYQAAAVSYYFNHEPARVRQHKHYSIFTKNETIGANNGIYNRDGRGFPDVAAAGDNILFTYGMDTGLGGGTSASAPIWASILNRINEERLAVGKKTVGFVNPVLYAHPEVFNDIVSGNNTACNSIGFVAAKGWDPVTGLGTPIYNSILQLYMSLP